MLATQEAQVMPFMQIKHFCTFISEELAMVACDLALLIIPALLRDCESGTSRSPEPGGLNFSRLWELLIGSESRRNNVIGCSQFSPELCAKSVLLSTH